MKILRLSPILTLPLLLAPSPALAQQCDAVPSQYLLTVDTCRAVEFLQGPAGKLLRDFGVAVLEIVESASGDGTTLRPFIDALEAGPANARFLELLDTAALAGWQLASSQIAREGFTPLKIGRGILLLETTESELPRLRAAAAPAGLSALLSALDVLVVEENFRYSLAESEPATGPPPGPFPLSVAPPRFPDDPLFPHQWGLHRIRAPEAWDHGAPGLPTAPVAVIDSGIDPSQRELRGSLWSDGLGHSGKRFCGTCTAGYDEYDVRDGFGHGTRISGVMGALPHNGFRVAGVNWYPILMILKAFQDGGQGAISDIVGAIDYARGEKASVISAAWGGKCRSASLLRAIYQAGREDVLVIAAAGNDSRNLDAAHNEFYPASFKRLCPDLVRNMIVVGATELRRSGGLREEVVAHASNWGPDHVVDLGAPGSRILTTGLEREAGIAKIGGTSAATAFVAGSAALVASYLAPDPDDPRPEAQEVKERLLNGADRLCSLKPYFSHGRRLNVLNAVLDQTGDDICPP